MLPNLFIAGFPKAATSSVHQWLSDHPEAGGSTPKETHYFIDREWSSFRPNANFLDHGLDRYEAYFDYLGAEVPRIVFESSVEYVYQRTALAELPDLSTRPTFVFLLREPAAQIRSVFQYLKHNRAELAADTSFDEFLRQVDAGDPVLKVNSLLEHAIANCRYADRLEPWLARCGADRIHVYLFESLRADPAAFMRRLAGDIGIDPGFYDRYAFPLENESYEVRSMALQRLNVAVRRALPRGRLYRAIRSVYRRLNTRRASHDPAAATLAAGLAARFDADNRRLAERFGLDLSSWKVDVRR